MRIVFVTWNLPPRLGGAERFAADLARCLARGHQVTVLAGRGADPLAGVTAWRSPLPRFIGFLVWLQAALPIAALRRRPCVVVTMNAAIGACCRPWTCLLRCPQVTVALGSDLAYGGSAYRRLLRASLRRTPLVVAISRATAELAVARGASPRRVLVLPPGIDPEFAAGPAGGELPEPAAPVLLYVGRVIARKGLAPFIEHALPRINARQPVELWVVGGEPADSLVHASGELDRVRRLVAASGARIRLLPGLDDAALRAAYRRASLLVLPAVAAPGDIEGFGLVFLEAALFGLPAVSARVGGIADAVVDQETGLLVESEDWRAFADAVLALLADPARRGELGRRARERARREFSWQEIGRRWSAALTGVADAAEPTR